MRRSTALPTMLLSSLLAAGFAAAAEPAPKVLLIGLDGVRVDILASASTPHIDALAARGALSLDARTRPNTVSGPGWSSMVTGVWMQKHGVTGNDFTDDNYEQFPDFLTRIEQLRPELSTLAVLDWPPLGTPRDGGPMISDIVDVVVNLNGDGIGYPAADAQSAAAGAWLLENTDVDAAFVYLGNIDVVGHDTSSLSSEYRASIEQADAQVGELIAAVERRSRFADEDWLVLMSTDHGRTDEGGHGGESVEELTIFYLASRLSGADVSLVDQPWIVDVAVTALAHLGIDIEPIWELDGRIDGIEATR